MFTESTGAELISSEVIDSVQSHMCQSAPLQGEAEYSLARMMKVKAIRRLSVDLDAARALSPLLKGCWHTWGRDCRNDIPKKLVNYPKEGWQYTWSSIPEGYDDRLLL